MKKGMMKRFGGLLLVVCMLMSLSSGAFAAGFECGFTSTDPESPTEETVSGDITSEEMGGVYISAADGGSVTVTVTGNLDVVGTGVAAHVNGSDSFGELSTGNISVDGRDGVVVNVDEGELVIGTGDIEVTGADPCSGISGYNNGGYLDVISGDISSVPDGEEGAPDGINAGIYLITNAEGSSSVEAGDIEAETFGIYNTASSGGDVTIEAGDIESDHIGVAAISSNGADSEIFTGDISADTGIVVTAYDNAVVSNDDDDLDDDDDDGDMPVPAPASVSVTAGDVTAVSTGISTVVQGGGATAYVKTGNVDAGETAVAITAFDGAVSVEVEGDASADEAGILVRDDGDAEIDLLVSGEISGEKAGIVLAEGTDPVSMNITTWSVSLNDEGHAVESISGDGYEYTEAAQQIESAIMYIIKVEQPQEGATLTAVDAEGEALAQNHNYEVATESEKVILKVDVQEGFKVSGAYNGLGEKTELLVDEAGNYYVIVPKGGGVYLSVEMEKDAGDEGDVSGDEGKDNEDPKPAAPSVSSEQVAQIISAIVSTEKKAKEILKVSGEENALIIRFFDDKSYTAELSDGTKESGEFFEKDGVVTLKNKAGSEMPIEKDEDGKMILNYVFRSGSDSPIKVELKDSQIEILTKALAAK